MQISYGDSKFSISDAIAIASKQYRGTISTDIKSRISKSSSHVQDIVASGKIVYGVNTGFGPLCDTRISSKETAKLQSNLLLSHAVGVGKPLDAFLVRLMMVTKIHALAKGYSGIRLSTIERIMWFLDNDIIPFVPEKGSVGASGDLAPLAHLFLPLIGHGKVSVNGGEWISTKDALNKFGMNPIELGPKEGLALINGTQFILAHSISALKRWMNILELADVVGAISLEALKGSAAPFDKRLHEIRPFKGNQLVAQRLRNLLYDSEVLKSHVDCDRVQDPYSLRCMPQVHGASRNAWLHLKELTEIELNSVTDNPIILSSDETISGGNFHGQSLALALDYAAFAAAELGNISDRRCYLMIEGRYELPKLLIPNAGLNSGLMIPQYTTAALVTENKTMCWPASADSVPTSLGQEDHVSMGSISGRKLHQILDNVEYILAIELLYATQALDFRRPLKSSELIEQVHELVRNHVSLITEDRLFADDIQILHELVRSNEINELISKNKPINDGFEEFYLS
ncbi:MAG TPA: histidine ammonia-lyase [Bacteroidetes bacterium]|nr:histidine ammonia-lyase [Bacteroidota bacterium]